MCTFGTRRAADQKDESVATGWELASGKKLGAVVIPVDRLSSHNGFVAALTDTTAVVVSPQRACVVDFVSGKKLYDLDCAERRAMPLVAPAVSPDGKTVAVCVLRSAVAERGSDVLVYDAPTGKARKTLTGPSPVWGMAFSRDGKPLLVGLRDTAALVYDLSAP